jgi:hypothetical protein
LPRVALLRRQAETPDVPPDFALVPRSMLRLRDFRFPNGDYVRFGDGPRRGGEPFRALEIAHELARREKDAAGLREFGGVLRAAVERGALDRGRLGPPLSGANVYLSPLALLWHTPEIAEAAIVAAPPRTTDVLPFAGLALQRNLGSDGDPAHALMAAVHGAAYVHSHASGMSLELFGAGQVLGTFEAQVCLRLEISPRNRTTASIISNRNRILIKDDPCMCIFPSKHFTFRIR